jgi:hypothetical protein
MKQKLLILALHISFVFLLGCMFENNDSKESIKEKDEYFTVRYKIKYAKIILKVHERFRVDKLDTKTGLVNITEKRSEDLYPPLLSISADFTSDSLKPYVRFVMNDIQSSFENYTNEQIEEKKVNGMQVIDAKCQFEQDGQSFFVQSRFFRFSKYIFALNIRIESERFMKDKKIYRDLLDIENSVILE